MVLCAVLTGCQPKPATNAGPTPLTAEELAYFNGTAFFNREYKNNTIDSINIRNQFLTSLYDAPADIDLFQLFYCGAGDETEAMSNEEEALFGTTMTPTTKISRARMDEVLKTYTGLSLSETKQVGLDMFTYSETYDAYYYAHGDTNYFMNVSFTKGEKKDGLIYLYYQENRVLTLKENGDSYLFVANQLVEDATPAG